MQSAGVKLQWKKHVHCESPSDNRILIKHNSFQAIQTDLCYSESVIIALSPGLLIIYCLASCEYT